MLIKFINLRWFLLSTDKLFNISHFENSTGLLPFSIHYKITDEEFLILAKKVIINHFGSCDYNLMLSSGTDNVLNIFNTGDLIYKIYSIPTRYQIMHCTYYVTKFILDSIFGEDMVSECVTSYRGQNRLYVNIYISYGSKSIFNMLNTFDDATKKRYHNIIRQLDVLEARKTELFDNINNKRQL